MKLRTKRQNQIKNKNKWKIQNYNNIAGEGLRFILYFVCVCVHVLPLAVQGEASKSVCLEECVFWARWLIQQQVPSVLMTRDAGHYFHHRKSSSSSFIRNFWFQSVFHVYHHSLRVGTITATHDCLVVHKPQNIASQAKNEPHYFQTKRDTEE